MKLSKGKKLCILGFCLVLIDQVIKILVKTNMAIGDHFNVLGDWFKIYFIENEGMAFGLSFGPLWGKIILTTFRLVLFGVLVWWINKLLKRKDVPTGVVVGLTLITAGALGNIIDCMFYGLMFSESLPGVVSEFGGHYAPMMLGKVVDMLYFPLIDTTWPSWMPFVGGEPFKFFEPIFNFADSCVTVGAFYLILFQYKFFLHDDEKKEKKAAK